MRFLDGWATEVIFSPDDNGWYGEVFDTKGKTVFTTKVVPAKQDAVNEMGVYTETHLAPKYKAK